MISLITHRFLSTAVCSRGTWNLFPSKFLSFWQQSRQLQATIVFHNEAFWDIEGSVAVKSNQSGSLDYITNRKEKEKIEITEPSDVIRITKFGHIRLDSENIAVEDVVKTTIVPETSEEEINFIDNQFFGANSLTRDIHTSPQHQSPTEPSTEVPLDTNAVDQQYFYPIQPTEEKDKSKPMLYAAPSASELAFEDNEIDDQYFGTKRSSETEVLPGLNAAPLKPGRMSAYSYINSLKSKEENSLPKSAEPSSKPTEEDEAHQVGRLTHKELIPNFRKLPNEIICSILKKAVLHNKDGIIAIDKPYGMVTTDSDRKSDIILTNYLPALSQLLRVEKLFTVHRLDRDTTGVLLLASDQETANRLNKLFFERKIIKKYHTITKGIPNPSRGTIDIPICEKTLLNRQRMTLRPILEHGQPNSSKYNAKVKSFKAVTHYKVVSQNGSAAFIELEPETGVRHQLRVHLSEAINCPVLGDHKYSHYDKLAPQKLPDDMLTKLGIRQSKVRDLPMHLHASSIIIPQWIDGSADLEIKAPLSAIFRLSMKRLKLFSRRKK